MKKTKNVWIIVICLCVVAFLVQRIYFDHKESDSARPQESIQHNNYSSNNILTDNNIIDLGNHTIAYYVSNDANISGIYGSHARDFTGDNYIAVQNIDQNEMIYFPDIYECLADIKMEDSGELYIQYTDNVCNKMEDIRIPVSFSSWIDDDFIDIISFNNNRPKLILSSQEGLRSEETVFPQIVWREAFSFREQMYEITFERSSLVYDLGLITGGLYADYRLTLKDEKGDVIEELMIINYPIVYEEVHWIIDFSEDGFMDIAIAYSDDWGMDSYSGQTQLLTLIWNQETLTFEKTIFPCLWQDQDIVHCFWSHPLWNEELSSLVFFVGRDNYGKLIMDMYSFLDGRWRRVRRLQALYAENEYTEINESVYLGYCELIYSADGNVVEEKVIEKNLESEEVWFDKESDWSRYNEKNHELFPGAGWDLVPSSIGGINIDKLKSGE